jgi:amidophosphoribosyltransferase
MTSLTTRQAELLQSGKTLEENCGVFGIVGQENASRATFFALYALNHRGQESAGIASHSSAGIHVHKGMGLVSQVFDEGDITLLKGTTAIGHTRYSTSGGSKMAGAQPFVLETDLGQLAIAHNGQVGARNAPRECAV